MNLRRLNQTHLAVQPGAGIPARGERPVFKKNGNPVTALAKRPGDVAVEGIVAVWPFADLLSVHENLRLAHRPIKEQFEAASVYIPDVYIRPVAALAHIRQSSAASCLFRRHCFPVLRHRDNLEVIRLVERSVNGPVVWHLHLLPSGDSLRLVVPTELPNIQSFLTANLSRKRQDSTNRRHSRQKSVTHKFKIGFVSTAKLPLISERTYKKIFKFFLILRYVLAERELCYRMKLMLYLFLILGIVV